MIFHLNIKHYWIHLAYKSWQSNSLKHYSFKAPVLPVVRIWHHGGVKGLLFASDNSCVSMQQLCCQWKMPNLSLESPHRFEMSYFGNKLAHSIKLQVWGIEIIEQVFHDHNMVKKDCRTITWCHAFMYLIDHNWFATRFFSHISRASM